MTADGVSADKAHHEHRGTRCGGPADRAAQRHPGASASRSGQTTGPANPRRVHLSHVSFGSDRGELRMGLVGAAGKVAREFVASAVFIGGCCLVVANAAADIARFGTGRMHPRRMRRAFFLGAPASGTPPSTWVYVNRCPHRLSPDVGPATLAGRARRMILISCHGGTRQSNNYEGEHVLV
jgi:hypothetical protein